MKTHLLFTLPLLFICNALSAQNTYVPDDNFEQALITLGYDSGELNDSVPTNAINSITYLNIEAKHIADLTGIEEFSSLEILDCARNDISNFDGLSALTNLQELDIHSNQLSALNTSSNTELKVLYCRDNQIASLDLQQNTKLEVLSCSDNQLSTLDIQHNPMLTNLRCGQNPIEELNLDANAELQKLDCPWTNLTTLNFPENSKMESIGCHSSKFNSLDLSMLDSLNYLLAYGNELISLDFSNNPKMNYLDCHRNALSELILKNGNIEGFSKMFARENPNLLCIEVDDVACAYAKSSNNWVKDNTASYSENCGTFQVSKTYVPDDNFEQALIDLGWDTGELDDSVATIKIIEKTYLDLRSKSISDLTGIEDFAALKYLYLHNNQLSNVPVQNNTSLIELSCSNNQLTEIGLHNLVNLELLQAYGNQIEALDLSNNPKLKKLMCDNNPIAGLDLVNNPVLEEVFCSYTSISEFQFPENPIISRLSCESANLEEIDLNAFDSLKYISVYNNKLETLDFSNCQKLEQVICGNNQLVTLLLPESGLIQTIDCRGNQLNILEGILGSNNEKSASTFDFTNLTYLNVKHNNFVFADFEPNWAQLSQLENFEYNIQNKIGLDKDTVVAKGSIFDLKIDGYIPGTNDEYTWYKNQQLMTGENNANILFNPVENENAGSYHCVITNTAIPDLTLHSYPTRLEVGAPVGIDGFETNNFLVYPNPAHQKVYVNTRGKTTNLQLINSFGQICVQKESFDSGYLDIGILEAGIYILKISAGNIKYTSKLVVK